MISIEFWVPGRPAPQGSKRYVGKSKKGRAILIEQSAYVKDWRKAVALAAWRAVDVEKWSILDQPCTLNVAFFIARPARPKFNQPAVAPDLSKLVRATEDALTKVIWLDDSRVVWTQSSKQYDLEPGAWIKVSTTEDAA